MSGRISATRACAPGRKGSANAPSARSPWRTGRKPGAALPPRRIALITGKAYRCCPPPRHGPYVYKTRGGSLTLWTATNGYPGRTDESSWGDTVAKILIVTGDAAESLEVMYPYQRLLEEGYEVDIAAPARKQLRFVVHDFEPGYDTYTEKPGYTWPADLAFSEVDPGAYVALVIPGGRAPEYLRNNAELRKIIGAFFSADRPVA